MIRNASALWKGGLKTGGGTLSTGSNTLKDIPYSFGRRFENDAGTNPEELIAGAYAACFAMALSSNAEKAGLTPESVDAKGALTFEKGDTGFAVTEIKLTVLAKIPGTSAADFEKLADATRTGCPIGKLLASGTKLVVDAKLA